MSDLSVAKRYADAMIAVAADAGAIDAVGSDLRGFTAQLDAHEGLLRAALCTPVFSKEERTAVLADLLPKLELNPLTGNFLHVLNAKGRMGAIGEISRIYAELADARAGRVAVAVITADKMHAGIEKDVQAALSKATGMTVVIQPRVDPDLIGGMVVKVGGKVYDSSIKTRLEQVKRSLLQAQAPAQAK